jgi:hypothetical protein
MWEKMFRQMEFFVWMSPTARDHSCNKTEAKQSSIPGGKTSPLLPLTCTRANVEILRMQIPVNR